VILLKLALFFGVLSLLTFGGVSSVVPEMQRYIVEENGWTTATDFMQLFAVAQSAPGPNVLISSLLGWRVAGFAGSIVALIAICAPAGVLAWWVSGLWERYGHSPWRSAVQRALNPLVVGLIAAGGYIIATPGGSPDWRLWLIAAATAGAMIATKVNPLWIMAAGGVAGGFLL
jgi:chromate transporter